MQRQARTEREWGQWPGRRAADQGGRDRLRALFTPSGGADAPAGSAVGGETDYVALSRAYEELDARERRLDALQAEVHALLRDDAAELDRRQTELDELAEALENRRRLAETAEASLADRRRELGAVELRRAAVERREELARTREVALEQRAEELASLARRLTDLGGSLVGDDGRQEAPRDPEHVVLEAADGYRLHVRPGPHPQVGALVELDDGTRLCTAVTRSPFPQDDRRCAVVERLVSEAQPSQASSSASPKKSAITAPTASAGT